MIEVEKFGGGALRVSYRDGRDDWIFWPFEVGAPCERVFITGTNTFWVYRGGGLRTLDAAAFDADNRVSVRRIQFDAWWGFVTRTGNHIVLHHRDKFGRNTPGANYVTIVRGSDFTQVARVSDDRLGAASSFYERDDGAIILGTLAGPEQATWIVTFDAGEAVVEERPGTCVPQGLYSSGGYSDRAGRRVVTVGAESVPIEQTGGRTLYGIPLKIWNLATLQVEETVVVDRAPKEFAPDYAGQDRLKRGDKWREKWERITAAVSPAVWDGKLTYRSDKDGDGYDADDPASIRRYFICRSVYDIAWELDGSAFWVLFGAGYLRRVTRDGVVSPRYVVQRIATPPVLGNSRWWPIKFKMKQVPASLEVLPDSSLRIMTRHSIRLMEIAEVMQYVDQQGVLHFDPAKFSLKGGLFQRLTATILRPRPGEIFVSDLRSGFIPGSEARIAEVLESIDRARAARLTGADKAAEARKEAFLAASKASAKKTAATAPAEPPVGKPEAPAPLPPGKIEVEKFGYAISGALRVSYGDGTEDWMFLPFRADDLKECHIVGDDRILAVSSKELRLYDANSRSCVGQRQVGYNSALHLASAGGWISVIGEREDGTKALTILSGYDLGEMLVIEDRAFERAKPMYERHDGALITGGFVEGPVHVSYVVTFEGDAASAERFDGKPSPGSYRGSYICPKGRRVISVGGRRIPIGADGDDRAYGVPLEIWSLDSLEIESEVVADHLSRRLQLMDKFDPSDWDGSLEIDRSLADEEAKRQTTILSQALSFLRDEVRGMAWELDGQAFWVLFSAGFLRRVSLDGTLSPRCIVERIWSPSPQATERHLGFGIEMRPDSRLRIDALDQKGSKSGYIYVRPEAIVAQAGAAGEDGEVWIRKKDDGYELKPPLKYRSDDEALEARKKAFEARIQEAPVALSDLSAPSCVAAIEALTEMIAHDPYELVCGYRFCPTFVLADGTPEERRMGEDEFFAHVAATAPEARDAIERLLHMWMDKVPLSAKHRNYYMNDKTVALSHALKALITLDPCCYDTIRRYVTETDLEHDVIIQHEVLPGFARLNGWRDGNAIKLGIFCMLEAWCGGSGGAWIDEEMKKRVEEAMSGREFAGVLIRETERYFSPDEASFNREAWDHNHVRGYLEVCETYNFGTKSAFDREAVAAINEYLKRDPR